MWECRKSPAHLGIRQILLFKFPLRDTAYEEFWHGLFTVTIGIVVRKDSRSMKSDGSRVKIFVYLLEEGTDAWRPTEAVSIGDGLFKILPAPDYDPEDEVWEFPPGSVVRCETRQGDSGEYIVAAKP